jgi:pimeloyl-ACP methyl ester carboxylesterase
MNLLSPDRIISPFRGKVTDFGGEIGLTSDFYPFPGSSVLCVLIPPWKATADYYKLVRTRIYEAGHSCLEFKIASSLLSHDYEYTRNAFNKVANDVRSDIEKMVGQYGFKEVQVIGVSIGCVEATMIANHNPYVTKLVLVAPGNGLAEPMWYGLKTKNVRRLYEQQGITLSFLKEAWQGLAPANNFDGLTGKEIDIYISKADINIPYRFGKELADQMIAHGLNPRVYENRYLGHYLTVVKYLLKGEIK